MTDCFVSYKREDAARVRPIVRGLRDAGLTVWWDLDISGGERWRESIVQHLDEASCIVVCWTTASIGPEGAFVREEAERAKARGVLLPVLLDPVAPPFGFGEVQGLDLMGWSGRCTEPRWQHVVATVRAIAAGEPRPKPPLDRIRHWSAVGATATIVAAALGFINDALGLQGALCATDSLRSTCRSLGLGHVPSLAEEQVWANAQRRPDGDGYRDYLQNYPQGAYAQAALARLAACRNVPTENWQKRDDALPLFMGAGPSAATEVAARKAALPHVLGDAQDIVCGVYQKADAYKLRGVRIEEGGWRCQDTSLGWRCGYEGKVVCEVDVRSTKMREVCESVQASAPRL